MDWLERTINVIDWLAKLSNRILPILGVLVLCGVLMILDDFKVTLNKVSSGTYTVRISSLPSVTFSENSPLNIRPTRHANPFRVMVNGGALSVGIDGTVSTNTAVYGRLDD